MLEFENMFAKLKKFALRKLLERQLKNAPEEQKTMLLGMLEKDPELFQKIAKEMQDELKKNNNNQMAAAMKILPKYQKEIMMTMTPEAKEKLMKMQMGHQGKFNPNGSIRR